MSQQLISLSPDLRRLRDEGYDVEIRASHVLVKGVPYVTSKGEIRRGTLVAPLGDMSADETRPPKDHTVSFIGEYPCRRDGNPIEQIRNNSETKTLGRGLVVNHYFSAKPKEGNYRDYHHKMTTYVAILCGEAEMIDAAVTARTCVVSESIDEHCPFHYIDTASTRAGIGAVTNKLEHKKIAIVGVGGTGSYILDFIAKTPVAEIHLFDGDVFANHNAFRSPGAPSIDELRVRPLKTAYFRDRYAKMHKHVIAHDGFLDENSINDLRAVEFVFLCLDRGGDKRLAVDHLVEWGIPFIDVGMGVMLEGECLRGDVRVTAGTPQKNDHLNSRINFAEGTENDYSGNIQIAELNALNAALAVIKWKKMCGYYQDVLKEHWSTYLVGANSIANDDQT